MGPTPPAAAPPVTAEYASALQAPKPNVPPVQSAYRFSRATDGKTRVDSGSTSVIQNPAAGQTILLDHVKKTATVHPAPPQAPPVPGMPQMPQLAAPGLPAAPHAPTVHVQDLGKSVLQGHPVEGKRYLIQPTPTKLPAVPKPPALQAPGMPKKPQLPGMPAAPEAASLPQAPKTPQASELAPPPQAPAVPPAPKPTQPPTVAEVWSSPSMGLPMDTKMSGGFGQLTQVCQSAVPGEPHPATFHIPPDYKVIQPPAKPPAPAAMSPTAPSQ